LCASALSRIRSQVSTEYKVDFEPKISTLEAFSHKRVCQEFEKKTKPTRVSADVIVMELYVKVPGEPDAFGDIGLTGNTYRRTTSQTSHSAT
jgi:hypothetical protein